ncbi:manganese efflux pump MntP family protein [Pseudogracilibacillus auburnensis]|uniref:Putative Mn2+ efflux pump MntP n=1 Tax=Pseudogracilibacillus auburnensis TaxID=1494959 RepID=A0A2V3W549_9BACI|nr:manganese efflux pump [Pseudogracilibacillus auburnensis]MBO1002061.1 manganese efflux pump [Pseudogracilibacillus auburnensis]PXW87385.1 putative Mn2+ efflux pump MntP [Pseudogracilibacillus auburnensis]
MFIEWLGGIGSLLLMSFALSVDGFSVSLGIGLQSIRLKRIAIIGLVIGLFHIFVPLMGILIGQFISLKLEYIASVISGFILVFIGSYMIFSAFHPKTYFKINPKGIKLLSVAFLVSVDSFPVGVSIGMTGIKTILIIFFFGCSATILAWIGMLIGRKAHSFVGVYSEVLGGIILFLFGLNSIFY